MLKSKVASAPQPTQPAFPAERPRSARPDETVIGAETAVRGGVECSGRLHLVGKLFGEVKVERLFVANCGSLEGVVDAGSVEVHGRLVGSLKAREVRLCSSARVEADIVYETLIVEPGARFEGRSFPGLTGPKA